MNKNKLWKSVQGELEVLISSIYYNTFFPETELKNVDEEKKIMTIKCPSKASKDVIETRYKDEIKNIVETRTNNNYKIELIVEKEEKKEEENKEKDQKLPLFEKEKIAKDREQKTLDKKRKITDAENGLLEDYKFENFLVGANNRLAYTVAKSIADNPGTSYNPFLIYSNVGLGKTHLLQAIGNDILEKNKNMNVLYCTGEQFANELIEALTRGGGQNDMKNFKEKFRSTDVWLIDDVQFIAGKKSTQEEFFHTFNHLYLNKKQIVLSTDRHPSEIATLEDRMASRFSMGMVADIQKPDAEMRNAILRNKRDELGLDINNKTIEFIAENVSSNIRELEGALIQVVTYSKAMDTKPTIEDAKSVLSNSIVLKEEKNIKPNKVLKTISDFYEIDIKEIKGKRRTKEIVKPRQVAMYLLKEINQLPLKEIGNILGGRDHTTIIYGKEKIEKEVNDGNFKLKKEISMIKDSIFENK